MKTCLECNSLLNPNAKFCTKCGAPVPTVEKNICLNPQCPKHINGYIFGDDDHYCDECGTLTSLGNKIEKYL